MLHIILLGENDAKLKKKKMEMKKQKSGSQGSNVRHGVSADVSAVTRRVVSCSHVEILSTSTPTGLVHRLPRKHIHYLNSKAIGGLIRKNSAVKSQRSIHYLSGLTKKKNGPSMMTCLNCSCKDRSRSITYKDRLRKQIQM